MKRIDLSKIMLASVAAACLLVPSGYADEKNDLKEQVKALQQKVNDLEKQLAAQPSQGNIQVGQTQADPSSARRYHHYYFDPFAQMEMMERQMAQMMNDTMVDFNPREDIKETPDAYIVSMDIPGMDKDKINVEVKNNMLIVSGERNSETKEEQPNQFYRQQRAFGHFYRSMPLPQDAKADNIDAQYKDGVLTVKVPRAKQAKPAAQKIKVK
jgi:HSP20 family protein